MPNGYCPAHQPDDDEYAIFLGRLETDQREPCPRCGSNDNPAAADLASVLWHHDSRCTAPLCRTCLEACDPVLAIMLGTWRDATAHLDAEWRRHLLLALTDDLDTRQVADQLANGVLDLPAIPVSADVSGGGTIP